MSGKPLPTGRFTGRYELLDIDPQPVPSSPWIVRAANVLLGGLGSPTLYLFEPHPTNPLTYTDSRGRVFALTEDFEFDGATTPRLAWWYPGFSPWDWPRAAAVHDWLFETHHRGNDILSFHEANELLGEMCRTLGVAEWKVKLIVWACNRFGKTLWDHNK